MSNEKTKTLVQKLQAIQQDLKVPKAQENKFGGFFYRSCEDILEAAKPLLHASELLLTITDEITETAGWVHVKATATLTDGRDTITVNGCAREPDQKKGMDSSQITGAASSYARKYALNGLFLIDDNKDADGIGAVGISEDQIKVIRKLIADTNTKDNEFCVAMGFESIGTIPASGFKRAVEALKAKKMALEAKAKKMAARKN